MKKTLIGFIALLFIFLFIGCDEKPLVYTGKLESYTNAKLALYSNELFELLNNEERVMYGMYSKEETSVKLTFPASAGAKEKSYTDILDVEAKTFAEVLKYGKSMPVIFSGIMTGYGPDCEGCGGKTGCSPRQNVKNGRKRTKM